MRARTGWILVIGLWSGCNFDLNLERLTPEQAREAVEEVTLAQQAVTLASVSIEVGTDFTIGDAVTQAAANLRSFVESQLPCAEVTLTDATLDIEYGAREGDCSYRGHEFAGHHRITVQSNDAGDIRVEHEWDNFNDGQVRIDGSAEVTWARDDRSRQIQHELTWTRLEDGLMGVGRGSRVQRPLEGDLREGIVVSGSRTWEGDAGRWSLDIVEDVEMRWADPVPQAGRCMIKTASDKHLLLKFTRIDEDTIEVLVGDALRGLTFHVHSRGTISQE